jgi:SAM-dependent methyltransferase
VRVVAGIGESIPLRDECADGLFVSSAWHWMDPPLAVPQIARVLRDGGRFGLIWTGRDREVDWVRALDQLREPRENPDPTHSAGAGRRNRLIDLPEGHPFEAIESASFSYTVHVSVDDLVRSVGTYSRIITASEDDRAETLAKVRAAVEDQFPGATEVALPIRSLCWRADLAR